MRGANWRGANSGARIHGSFTLHLFLSVYIIVSVISACPTESRCCSSGRRRVFTFRASSRTQRPDLSVEIRSRNPRFETNTKDRNSSNSQTHPIFNNHPSYQCLSSSFGVHLCSIPPDKKPVIRASLSSPRSLSESRRDSPDVNV